MAIFQSRHSQFERTNEFRSIQMELVTLLRKNNCKKPTKKTYLNDLKREIINFSVHLGAILNRRGMFLCKVRGFQ